MHVSLRNSFDWRDGDLCSPSPATALSSGARGRLVFHERPIACSRRGTGCRQRPLGGRQILPVTFQSGADDARRTSRGVRTCDRSAACLPGRRAVFLAGHLASSDVVANSRPSPADRQAVPSALQTTRYPYPKYLWLVPRAPWQSRNRSATRARRCPLLFFAPKDDGLVCWGPDFCGKLDWLRPERIPTTRVRVGGYVV